VYKVRARDRNTILKEFAALASEWSASRHSVNDALTN
jgi:hypothetical protein